MANEDGHRQESHRSAIDGTCVGEHAAINCKGIILFYLFCVTLVQFASVCVFLDEIQSSSYKTIGLFNTKLFAQDQHQCCHAVASLCCCITVATTCCFVPQLCSLTYVLIIRAVSCYHPLQICVEGRKHSECMFLGFAAIWCMRCTRHF